MRFAGVCWLSHTMPYRSWDFIDLCAPSKEMLCWFDYFLLGDGKQAGRLRGIRLNQ